jgi:hypothetical protein
MKPIKFKEQNCVYAENQPEYAKLPVHKCETEDGLAISCWSLSVAERLKILFTGKIWLMQLTFKRPLQPQLPTINSPFKQFSGEVKS